MVERSGGPAVTPRHRHALLLPGVELLPTERVDEHGVLLQVLLQRALLRQQVRILVVYQNLLVLNIGPLQLVVIVLYPD